MKKLIEKVFDKDDISIFGKDRIKVVDENSRKLNVEYLRAKSIENILSGKFERVVFNVIDQIVFGLAQLDEYSKRYNSGSICSREIGELEIVSDFPGIFEKSIYSSECNVNFSILNVDRIRRLRFILTLGLVPNLDVLNSLSNWCKFLSGVEIDEMYYYYGIRNKDENFLLINNLKVKTLIVSSRSIPGYKYEIDPYEEEGEFGKVEDFRDWCLHDLDKEKANSIKKFIQTVIDSNQIENIFVEDNRSDLVYNIEGKFYYRMFDLKEYLKL